MNTRIMGFGSFFAVSLLFCNFLLGKERLVVFDFSSIGIEESAVKTVGQLFRYEFNTLEKFDVIERHEMVELLGDTIQVSNKSDALKRAIIFEADKAVLGEINALGTKIILTAMIIDVLSGTLEYSQTTSSLSLEDLETVIKRLVASLAERKPLEETAEVEKIMEKETIEPKRRSSFYTFGIRFGHIEPFAGFAGAREGRIELGLTGWYEAPDFMAELAWTFNSPWMTFEYDYEAFSDQRVEISLIRLLSRKDISPYFGAGLGIHWVSVSSERYDDYYGYYYSHHQSGTGFGANMQAGLVMFRTYDFRLLLNLRYHMINVDLGDGNFNHAISINIGLLHKQKAEDSKGCIGCLGF